MRRLQRRRLYRYRSTTRELQALDDGGVRHAPCFAHGLQTVSPPRLLQPVEHRRHEPCSRTTERMTQRYSATTRVQPLRVRPDLPIPSERHAREGLVDLKVINVCNTQLRLRKRS